jgi:preprotein translocase subunit SecB
MLAKLHLNAQEKFMADDAIGNGQADKPPATADTPQQLIVNAQYVKDLSFENPRAPQSLIQPSAQPSVDINVDVKAQNLGPEVFEVVLTINVTARVEDQPVFLVELAYGTVVTVRNAPQEMLAPLILIETPRIVFPFARAIIANATRDGGFPPLLINPIDFAELLRRQQEGAQAASLRSGEAG